MLMRTERPTGETLYNELAEEAERRGVKLLDLAKILWPSDPVTKLEQMMIAEQPKDITIARIRAVIEGRPSMPARHYRTLSRGEREALGFPPSRNSELSSRNLANHLAKRREDEDRLRISRLAAERRMPGETIEAAARRLEREMRS